MRSENLIPLLGYADPLSGRPGDVIAFKVSSRSDAPYRAHLMRVICADPNPAGRGLIEERVQSDLDGEHRSRWQPFHPGSYARITTQGLFQAESFTILATIWPTTPEHDRQSIVSCRGAAAGGINLYLDSDGCGASLDFSGQRIEISTGKKIKTRQWHRVWASFDHRSRVLRVGQINLPDDKVDGSEVVITQAPSLRDINRVFIAALDDDPPRDHYNGKIEAPMIFDRCLNESEITRLIASNDAEPRRLRAHWDFSRDISSTRIEDLSPEKFHGALINLPARAMTGARWDGSEMCWRHKPAHYGAIHFHDDDIYDFEWDTDFSFTIPPDFRPGAYAVRIQCGDAEDAIPFFACAPKPSSRSATKPRPKLCVLVSTFTYTVYGNHARPNFDPVWLERMKKWQAYPYNPAMHRDYGLSTYNFHTDGSGICHASHRRPLLTMRPGYLTFGDGECSGLRHFQADSHLLAWLEQNDIAYDLITDQELHDDGVAAIAGYRAVTTGSHPEYHTTETLDALHAYRAHGGNFIYLGGNGFYWKVALHTEDNGAIEIRRAEGGIRAWAAEPGEYHQAFDGGYGGMWRRNGRPPQQLAGVGFSAQGIFIGSYYRRRAETFTDPNISWLFDGIDEKIIGDFGFSGGGAAGFELDRIDTRLGSPENLHILASSENHADTFVLVPEEQLTHQATWSGEPAAELIRADMIYQVNAHGGQLFSTGSITFCGSLPHHNFDNNISKLLLNVIAGFTR